MPKWNPGDLRRLVREHSISGYRVRVPLFVSRGTWKVGSPTPSNGTIEKQIRPEKGGFIFYKVVADNPIPFSQFADNMRVSAKPMTMKEWRNKFVKGTASFPAIAADLREKLEAGGMVSQADVLFRELVDRGCVDIDQNVFCYTFPAAEVLISDPEPGQLVEIDGGWPGVVIGFENVEKAKKKLILIQEFTPVPYLRTPEALLPAAVEKSYTLPLTWVLGVDLVKAIEKTGGKLPPGEWSENREDYVLEQPIPLSEIEDFCEDPKTWEKLGQGKNILCLQQAMMLHTLPLVRDEITLRPLPEGTTDDVVASITEIEEMETGDISWPREEE